MFSGEETSADSSPPWPVHRLRYLIDEPPPMLLPRCLEDYRQRWGLTLRALADYLGVSTSKLAAWRGGRLPRQREQLDRITQLLSTPPVRSTTPRTVQSDVVARLALVYLQGLPEGQPVSIDAVESIILRLRAAVQG